MNPEQAKSMARHFGTFFGGLLVGWAASRGYQWGDIINQLLSSEVFIGLLASGFMAGWGFLASRLPSLIAILDVFAKKPSSPVAAVIMKPTVEGKAIADSIPGSTTVVAGTGAAADAAKS